jgi:hypothetical protein
MNTNTLKAITIAGSLLTGMGAASPALATTTGVQALGFAQNSVDVWTFTCPIFFPRGRATVQDIAPFAPLNLMQVVLGQASATNQVTDLNPILVGGEGFGASIPAVVNGVAGQVYAAAFKKTLLGNEGYIGDLYCTNVFNIRINPIITRQINQ